MKQLITTLVMVFMFSTVTMAQATFMLDDFESGTVSFTEVVNINPPAHFDVAIVDNPVKAGINTSNKVWEWKRYDAEAENKIWAGFYSAQISSSSSLNAFSSFIRYVITKLKQSSLSIKRSHIDSMSKKGIPSSSFSKFILHVKM